MNDKKSDAPKSRSSQEGFVEPLGTEPSQEAPPIAITTIRRHSKISSPRKGKPFPYRKSTFTADDLDPGYLGAEDQPLFVAAKTKSATDVDDVDFAGQPNQYGMRRISDIDWKRYSSSGQDPLLFLIGNGHQLYGRIDDRNQLVALGVKDRGDYWPVVQFCESLQFFAVDHEVISEVLATGESQREAFEKCGLWYARQEDGADVLAPVEFEKCILVRKDMIRTTFLNPQCNENGLSPLISLFLAPKETIKEAYVDREPEARTILDFSVQRTFTRESIWFNENDLKERPITFADLKLNRSYKFLHREISPAIYWIFQVAYNRNALGSIPGGVDQVRKILEGLPGNLIDDLGTSTRSKLMSGHCARFAFKLIENTDADGRLGSDVGKLQDTRVADQMRWARFKVDADFIGDDLSKAIGLADVWASRMRVFDEDFPSGKFGPEVRSPKLSRTAVQFCKEVCKYFPNGEAKLLFQLITGRELPQSIKEEFEKALKPRSR